MNENAIEGRNAVIEAFRAGKTIDRLYVQEGVKDGPVQTVLREAKKQKVKVDFVKYDANGAVIDNSNIDRIVDYEMIVYSEILQNTETGLYVSGTTSEYGYEYKDGSYNTNNEWQEGEWKEAWKSFLKMT